MEDKIEVNEYVRTRAGHINKITNIDENGLIYWNKIQCGWSEQQLEDIIVKHSKQPIDLIEVKDVIKYRINNIIFFICIINIYFHYSLPPNFLFFPSTLYFLSLISTP